MVEGADGRGRRRAASRRPPGPAARRSRRGHASVSADGADQSPRAPQSAGRTRWHFPGATAKKRRKACCRRQSADVMDRQRRPEGMGSASVGARRCHRRCVPPVLSGDPQQRPTCSVVFQADRGVTAAPALSQVSQARRPPPWCAEKPNDRAVRQKEAPGAARPPDAPASDGTTTAASRLVPTGRVMNRTPPVPGAATAHRTQGAPAPEESTG